MVQWNCNVKGTDDDNAQQFYIGTNRDKMVQKLKASELIDVDQYAGKFLEGKVKKMKQK